MKTTKEKSNPTPHLNRRKVRQTALEIASVTRPANKFKRVGLSFIVRVEQSVLAAIRSEVWNHPSKGKTLK